MPRVHSRLRPGRRARRVARPDISPRQSQGTATREGAGVTVPRHETLPSTRTATRPVLVSPIADTGFFPGAKWRSGAVQPKPEAWRAPKALPCSILKVVPASGHGMAVVSAFPQVRQQVGDGKRVQSAGIAGGETLLLQGPRPTSHRPAILIREAGRRHIRLRE